MSGPVQMTPTPSAGGDDEGGSPVSTTIVIGVIAAIVLIVVVIGICVLSWIKKRRIRNIKYEAASQASQGLEAMALSEQYRMRDDVTTLDDLDEDNTIGQIENEGV